MPIITTNSSWCQNPRRQWPNTGCFQSADAVGNEDMAIQCRMYLLVPVTKNSMFLAEPCSEMGTVMLLMRMIKIRRQDGKQRALGKQQKIN